MGHWGLKGFADASVSQFFSYLGEQVEAAPPAPVPTRSTRMKRSLPDEHVCV
jgi:hypothetical protein